MNKKILTASAFLAAASMSFGFVTWNGADGIYKIDTELDAATKTVVTGSPTAMTPMVVSPRLNGLLIRVTNTLTTLLTRSSTTAAVFAVPSL